MLKRTYALGLLAAATLGCFLTPAAQASQVEVNKQTAEQMPLLVLAIPFTKTLTTATRTNWTTQVQVITIPNLNPNKSRIKMPSKMAQLLVAMPFFKTLTKTIFRSKSVLNSRLSIGFH